MMCIRNILLLLLCWCSSTCWRLALVEGKTTEQESTQGPKSKKQADTLYSQGEYEEAASWYWKAVLFHTQTPAHLKYDLNEVFGKFMQCYQFLGRPVDGLAFVSLESFRRNQPDMGHNFLNQALQMDPNNEAALAIKRQYVDGDGSPIEAEKKTKKKPDAYSESGSSSSKATQQSETVASMYKDDPEIRGKSPEALYDVASTHFANRDYEDCADVFEISCQLSENTLGPSCANAVYCRSMIVDWGYNGTQFEADMERIATITERETKELRYSPSTGSQDSMTQSLADNNFVWQRATSVHPHMMLGYPLPPLLKRFVAESVAYMDEMMARAKTSGTLPPLPDDLPYPIDPEPWLEEKQQALQANTAYRIRVGFVGSGFNSKAVLYLSQDMYRFFDSSKFEIHIFSFGPADSPLFIQHGMRGVDWRKRVQSNVDHFHDLQHLTNNHIEAARYVRDQKIHILIEWDGYARQGERAQGLFGLRPAPIQMLHQEYLGTSGALYVDYIFTDKVTSPPNDSNIFFTEKLIYMPNHFFSKGHAMQSEVAVPTYDYVQRSEDEPYALGKGTPQQNRCLAPPHVGPSDVSFVYCNWNKLLKNNPETVRSWIRILREVPNSILCLLENPKSGAAYLRKFVHEAAGTTDERGRLIPGDGDELNSRIHFLTWEKNPFDHQQRNLDFCNVMLDSYPYNGHTVAQDSLYAGVPIVTRSDGRDMSSRVSTSANLVLGLSHLNAINGPQQYEDIAIEVGTNKSLYKETRTKLIDSCLQRNPMHPYWDVARYVKNFEQGLQKAWDRFLLGHDPDHIFIEETPEAAAGTYDEEILAHPPEGKSAAAVTD